MAGTRMGFMAQPWRDKRSGIYYIRRRIPKDVQPALTEFGEFYKRSLDTRSREEAKIRFAAQWVASEELFQKVRLQVQGRFEPTRGDAALLASRWAQREVEDLDVHGNYPDFLVETEDGYETVWTHYDIKRARATLEADRLSSALLGRLNQWIDEELQLNGFPPKQSGSAFHKHLLEAFLVRLGEVSKLAYGRMRDDYTLTLAQAPNVPLSVAGLLTSATDTRLSSVFEAWVKRTKDTDGNTRDVLKRVSEYGATITRFIEFFGDMPVVHIPAHRDRPFRLNVTACSGLT